MGITKFDVFESNVNEMADLFKALGHPARFSIVQFLINQPSCICNDIIEFIPLAQPTISRHLSELKKVGLIKGTISGKNICYCINPIKMNLIKDFINAIAQDTEQNKECC